MIERPWLSVIMPTYNGVRFLEAALTSVAAQEDRAIEVVAVDDGSTDGTLDTLRRWSRRFRMTVIERSHVGNWVLSTAEGMAAARGHYFCWLHQDDTWRGGRIAALRRRLAEHKDAAFVVHPCWYSDSSGKRIGYWRCSLPRAPRLLRYTEVAAPLLVQCSFATCGAIFSAEAAQAVGPPDGSLIYHGDWDYWLRLSRLGRTLFVPTPLASFRIHPASQTIAQAHQADRRLGEARAVLRRHLVHFRERGGDAERVGRVAVVSAEINYALSALLTRDVVDLSQLTRRIAALGPSGCATLLRDSRLGERCLSRLQASAGLRPAIGDVLRAVIRRCAAGAEHAAGKAVSAGP